VRPRALSPPLVVALRMIKNITTIHSIATEYSNTKTQTQAQANGHRQRHKHTHILPIWISHVSWGTRSPSSTVLGFRRTHLERPLILLAPTTPRCSHGLFVALTWSMTFGTMSSGALCECTCSHSTCTRACFDLQKTMREARPTSSLPLSASKKKYILKI
jgi:hypothetical protein